MCNSLSLSRRKVVVVLEDNGVEAQSTNRPARGCGMRRWRRRRTWDAVSRRQQRRRARQRWARARPPRGRCRGGRTSPVPMSTPPRYLQTQQTAQKKHTSDPKFRRCPEEFCGKAAGVVTCEGERVGLAGGDGGHLGRHLREVASEWRRMADEEQEDASTGGSSTARGRCS